MVFLQYENQKLLLPQHNEIMTPPDAHWVHLMPHRCVLAATGVWEGADHDHNKQMRGAGCYRDHRLEGHTTAGVTRK